MDIEAFGLTDIGLEREHNEDAFLLLQESSLYLVADGMGGHKAGDVASGMAVATIAEFFRSSDSADSTWPHHFDASLTLDENRILTAIQLANAAILRSARSEAERQGMGTTVVAVVASRADNRLYVCHVGDSRCYRLRGDSIELLTTDHSLYNEYAQNMPDLGEEQLAALPRNVITRALGMQEHVKVDLRRVDAQPGDVYLLCTDGLSGMVTDAAILEIVSKQGPDLPAIGSALIAAALDAGGEDNATVLLVRIGDSESR